MKTNENFKEISLIGRMAYAIMCIERYLINQYPTKDWTLLSEEMWKATSEKYVDDWAYRFIELIPQHLLEKPDFLSSCFEEIDENCYNKFKTMYKNTLNDINALLMALLEMGELAPESDLSISLNSLNVIINYLENKNILLPSVESVKFSKITEKCGWGKPFDGTYLSIILKK